MLREKYTAEQQKDARTETLNGTFFLDLPWMLEKKYRTKITALDEGNVDSLFIGPYARFYAVGYDILGLVVLLQERLSSAHVAYHLNVQQGKYGSQRATTSHACRNSPCLLVVLQDW